MLPWQHVDRVLLTLALHGEEVSMLEVHLKQTKLGGACLAEALAKSEPEFASGPKRKRDDGYVLLTISEELLIVRVPAAGHASLLVEVAIHVCRMPFLWNVRKETAKHNFCESFDEGN